eukprot:3588671-Pyramimonas_sp.AAC.1
MRILWWPPWGSWVLSWAVLGLSRDAWSSLEAAWGPSRAARGSFWGPLGPSRPLVGLKSKYPDPRNTRFPDRRCLIFALGGRSRRPLGPP